MGRQGFKRDARAGEECGRREENRTHEEERERVDVREGRGTERVLGHPCFAFEEGEVQLGRGVLDLGEVDYVCSIRIYAQSAGREFSTACLVNEYEYGKY